MRLWMSQYFELKYKDTQDQNRTDKDNVRVCQFFMTD